jgi:hypothetical protein
MLLRWIRAVFPLVVLILAPFGRAAAQDAPEVPRVGTRALEVRLAGRMQIQYSTTSVDDAVPLLWEVRRARLEVGVRVNERVSLQLNPEFAGSTIQLRDAFLRLSFAPEAEVMIGQAMRPFSRLAQVSSTRILPIERGARIRGLAPPPLDEFNLLSGLGLADRDVGLQLRGTRGVLGYAVAVTNGPLTAERVTQPTAQATARLSVALAPVLQVGAAASRTHFVASETAAIPDAVRPGWAAVLDAQWGGFDRGLHLLAQASAGALDPFDAERARFRAAQVWLAYRSPEAGPHRIQLEPIGRLSLGRPDATVAEREQGRAGGLLLTPGLNLYLDPRNRIMLNYDRWRPYGGSPTSHAVRVQFQAAF